MSIEKTAYAILFLSIDTKHLLDSLYAVMLKAALEIHHYGFFGRGFATDPNPPLSRPLVAFRIWFTPP